MMVILQRHAELYFRHRFVQPPFVATVMVAASPPV